MAKLFLIDAYALIYRSYYALIRNPRINSKGFNTSAILGFCNTLNEIITKENPSHIGVHLTMAKHSATMPIQNIKPNVRKHQKTYANQYQ